MSTITIKNTSKGGLVLPLANGDGVLIAPGEDVPVAAKDLADAKKLPVVAAWFADGKLVEAGEKSVEKPAEKPAKAPKVKVEG